MTKIKNISRDIVDIIEESNIGSENYRKICNLCKELYDINYNENNNYVQNERYNIIQHCHTIIKDVTKNINGLLMYMILSIISYILLIILYIERDNIETENEINMFDLVFGVVISMLFLFTFMVISIKSNSESKLERIEECMTNIEIRVI